MKDQQKASKKTCSECRKVYDPGVKNKKYCSPRCKMSAWRKQRDSAQHSINENQAIPLKNPSSSFHPAVSSLLHGVDPQLAIAIDFLRRESARWEQAYNEERLLCEELEDSLGNLQRELIELEHAKVIERLENSKPSGLQGLSENPIIIKLTESIGPALGAIAMKFVEGGNGYSPTTSEGEPNSDAVQVSKWLLSLPEDTRKTLMEIFDEIATYSPQKRVAVIDQINKELKTGHRFLQPHEFNSSLWGIN